MKKLCSCCSEKKDHSEFYVRKDGRSHSYCKNCLLKVQKDRWKSRKAKAVELFGGNCCLCGYNRNLAALDFHHLEPSEKEFNWNRLNKRPWNEIINELKKCTLLCRNCHAETHHPEYTLEIIGTDCANKNLDKDRVTSLRRLTATGACPQCSGETYGTKYCSIKCAQLSKRKVIRPSREQLEKEIETMSWVALGLKYDVSDNAIRKWAKQYGLKE